MGSLASPQLCDKKTGTGINNDGETETDENGKQQIRTYSVRIIHAFLGHHFGVAHAMQPRLPHEDYYRHHSQHKTDQSAVQRC